MKQNVVFGFLGSKRDAGFEEDRWENWRPTVALGMYRNLHVDRFELFHESKDVPLLDRVIADLKKVSPKMKVVTNLLNFNNPWDFEEVYSKLFDVMKAYRFEPDTEEYLFHIKTGTHALQICYFLLTEARFFPGKLLQSFPPRPDRPEEKTVGSYKIIDLDLSNYRQIVERFDVEKVESTSFLKLGIATKNKAFNHLIEQIERVATNAREPILLTGGTGVGKSLLARRIHELKKLQGKLTGPFVGVNSATLRGDQSMATLFGHTKGAFTGAAAERAGLLKVADKGLFFLDEIGELGLDEQAMLLKAIEEKQFTPVGSDSDTASDFQLIAATNRDLIESIAVGTFREDLLARINLWTFRLPDLKDRREDIEPNIEYELKQYAERNGRKIVFAADARERFVKFAKSPGATWRANFRDLNAAIIRMATLAPGDRITSDTVKEEIVRLTSNWNNCAKPSADNLLLRSVLGEERTAELDLFDEVQLVKVVEVCRQSKSLAEAGRKLFQHSRTKKKSSNDSDRVSKYLAGFGLDWEEVQK